MPRKSPLEPKIKEWCEWQLRHYQDQRQQLAAYRAELMPSSVSAYGQNGGGGSGGESRPTEITAIRLTTAPHIAYLEQSVGAVSRVLSKLDAIDAELVRLHYFLDTHTVEGAAYRVHIGKTAAYDRVNKVLCAVAAEMGIISEF